MSIEADITAFSLCFERKHWIKLGELQESWEYYDGDGIYYDFIIDSNRWSIITVYNNGRSYELLESNETLSEYEALKIIASHWKNERI